MASRHRCPASRTDLVAVVGPVGPLHVSGTDAQALLLGPPLPGSCSWLRSKCPLTVELRRLNLSFHQRFVHTIYATVFPI